MRSLICEYDIVSGGPLPDEAREILEGYRVYEAKGSQNIWSKARKSRVFINWRTRVSKEMLADAECLKLIITRSTGYDHINVKAAEQSGVCVANQPELINEAVAESVVAGILAMTRMVLLGHEYVISGEWSRRGWPYHLRGTLIRGRSLGLLGAGWIASRVAQIMGSLGASPLLYYSRSRKPWLEASLGAKKVGLKELFSSSDILINILPLSKETRDLIKIDLLRRLPKNSIYVNVGRGKTEDAGAIFQLAIERPDVYLFLDVHRDEPLPEDDNLVRLARKRSNILLAPHFAGYSQESFYGVALLTAIQARDYLEEGCTWNPVNDVCSTCMTIKPSLDEAIKTARLSLEKERSTEDYFRSLQV